MKPKTLFLPAFLLPTVCCLATFRESDYDVVATQFVAEKPEPPKPKQAAVSLFPVYVVKEETEISVPKQRFGQERKWVRPPKKLGGYKKGTNF